MPLTGWRRLCCLFGCMACASGFAAAAERQRSHAERFSSREAKLKTAEQDAAVRLRANPKDVKALLDCGQAELSLGKLDSAVRDYELAAVIDPTLAEAESRLAYALWLKGRFERAEAAARAALARDSENALAHRLLGRLLLLTGGDRTVAIRHLQKALQLDPEETDARFDLLMAYRTAGDVERAWAELRLLRAAYAAQEPRLLYSEGLLASDQNRQSFALDRFRQALAADPNLSEARQALGIALVESARWSEALDVLAPLARGEHPSFRVTYAHALALEKTQHWTEAEHEARRALGLNPGSAEASELLGRVLAESGRAARGKE